MYVIGRGKNDAVICQMTKDEYAQILGAGNYYYLQNQKEDIVVGASVNIGDIYLQVKEALSLPDTLFSSAKNLQAALLKVLSLEDRINPIKTKK